MQIIDLKQIEQYYGTWITLQEGCAREEYGKEGNQKL
jgi:hypothetical protein